MPMELIVFLLLQICFFFFFFFFFTFLFCYERDFMKSLSREIQADIIEVFNSTSRYLEDLLNIGNIYFKWPNGGPHIPYWTPIK